MNSIPLGARAHPQDLGALRKASEGRSLPILRQNPSRRPRHTPVLGVSFQPFPGHSLLLVALHHFLHVVEL